jgi:hypothetical protein
LEIGPIPHQRLRRRHLHHPVDQEAAHLGLVDDVGEQVAHVQHVAEAREDGPEALVLAPGLVQVDDVVVEELLAVGRRDGEQLGARSVADHRPERTDLRGDAYAGPGRAGIGWHMG